MLRLGQRPASLGRCLHQTGPEDCGAGSTRGPPRRPINKEQLPLGYTRLIPGSVNPVAEQTAGRARGPLDNGPFSGRMSTSERTLDPWSPAPSGTPLI